MVSEQASSKARRNCTSLTHRLHCWPARLSAPLGPVHSEGGSDEGKPEVGKASYCRHGSLAGAPAGRELFRFFC